MNRQKSYLDILLLTLKQQQQKTRDPRKAREFVLLWLARLLPSSPHSSEQCILEFRLLRLACCLSTQRGESMTKLQ